MNWIDIVLGLVLLYALFAGFRKGLVVELCGILGLIIGAYLAYIFSERTGIWLDFPPEISWPLAFVLIMVVVLIAIMIIGRLVSKVLDLAGLGAINKLLGALASLIKVALIFSLLLTAFDNINKTTGWIKESTIQRSSLYQPVKSLSSLVFPYINFGTLEQLYKNTIKKHSEPDSSPEENKTVPQEYL